MKEIEALYLDAIAAARRFIYIENQYFTSTTLCDALAARLEEEDGPEIVMVLPVECSGWLEETTMGVFRRYLLRRLSEADRHDRLRICYPAIRSLDNDHINVHSKILVIDDTLVRIGSSNMSNRSMGLDTECDLAIESGDEERIRKAIASFRNRLMGEHLGVSPQEVAEVLDAKESLQSTIDTLQNPDRSLLPLPVKELTWKDGILLDTDLIDPERPIEMEKLIETFVHNNHNGSKEHAVLRGVVVLLILAGLAAAWQWTPLKDYINADTVIGWIAPLKQSPFAFFLVVAIYVVGGLVTMPVTLLILATAIIFDPLLSFFYSLAGTLASALLMYTIGRLVGRDTVRSLAGARINRISKRISKRGFVTVAIIRMIPVAPFSIVNMVAGASHIHWRDFALGTLVGMTPGILAITIFESSLHKAIRNPDIKNFAALAVLIVLTFTGALWVRRRLANNNHLNGCTSSEEENKG